MEENKADLSELSEKAKTMEPTSLMDTPKPKKSRGRPPKEKIEAQIPKEEPKTAPQPQIPTSLILRTPLDIASKTVAAAYVGDMRAAMTSDELNACSEALGMLIDKYFPNVLEKYGPEVMCIMVFGQYGIRLYALKRAIEEEKKSKINIPNTENSAKIENPIMI